MQQALSNDIKLDETRQQRRTAEARASTSTTRNAASTTREVASRHNWSSFSTPFTAAQNTLTRAPGALRSSVTGWWTEQDQLRAVSSAAAQQTRRASSDISGLGLQVSASSRSPPDEEIGSSISQSYSHPVSSGAGEAEPAWTARERRRRSYAGPSNITTTPTVTLAPTSLTPPTTSSLAHSAPSVSTMSRLFGDNSRRPASAGGSSKPFNASSKTTSKTPSGQPPAPESVSPRTTPPSPLSRQTVQTSSPRSIGSSTGLASESSWSSLGSILSSVPSSILSSSPNSSAPNKSSSFSPKRPSTAPAKHYEGDRLPPLQPGSNVGIASVNNPCNIQQSRTKSSTLSQAPSANNIQSVREEKSTQSSSAGQPEKMGTAAQTIPRKAVLDKPASKIVLSSKGGPPQLQKDLHSTLTLPHTMGSISTTTRYSGEFSATDSTRSVRDSRPSIERASNSSSRKDGDTLPQTDPLFGLPYGQKSTISATPDRPSVITSGPGYQSGNEDSSDWSFFSRSNWSSPPDHPFSPDKVPYSQGYDSRLLDFRYMRYQAARREGCMLPWSEKEKFRGFRPNRALDVGCEISAPWIFEAAETWTETHFTGIDIAPILIPPSRYPRQSASRISFIQANFLERWPFEDDSFDFVRIAFAGDSIPEDSWHHVFDEATRVLNKAGRIQCIDDVSIITPPVESIGALQREESKNQSILPAVSSSAPVVLSSSNSDANKPLNAEEPESGEPHTAVQVKLNAFQRALESMDHSFQKRMMSLYRTSIFPAAMVLTCKDIVTQGPMRVGLGVKETDENVSTGVRDTENIDATVFVDAMAGAMDSWASIFRDTQTDSSNDSTDLRAQAELEKCWRTLAGTVRNKSDITNLLSKRFGWTCQTDELIESALEKQVVAVETEKQTILALQVECVDEYKMTEVDRALRDVKADLAATR